jgi:hypothetical protein
MERETEVKEKEDKGGHNKRRKEQGMRQRNKVEMKGSKEWRKDRRTEDRVGRNRTEKRK